MKTIKVVAAIIEQNGKIMIARRSYGELAGFWEFPGGKYEERETGEQAIKREIEEEYPLLPPEADDRAKAVQRKGVEVMGGKKSNAYANTDLRRKVYWDIYTEIKRNFGLIDERGRQKSYKKLKRRNLKGAMMIVDEYILPISLENEVDEENDLGDVT